VPAATPLPRGPSVLTLYSAADLLTAPGCPVCRYATEASDRYLGWFALEGHAQPTMITRLCSSLGMCASHTRRLMSQPGAAIRLTAVYRYVVTAARDRLAGPPAPPAACPACEHDEAAAGRALDTLLEDLADPSVLDRFRELGGLCLPHLAAATARSRRAAPLANTAQDTIAARELRCDWLAGTDHDAQARAVLRRAVPASGSPGAAACAPCLAGAQAEQDALSRLTALAGDAPDPALTLCASHLADAALAAGARGIRSLLAWQLRCLTSRPPAGRARWLRTGPRRRDVSDCAVCRARRAAVQRRLAGLPDTPQLPRTEAALCARHHLILRAADPRGTRLPARTAARRADELAAELADAFDRISRAHSTGTPAPESTAWQRAAAFLDGSVFGGRCGPPPAGPLHQ
jgi:hypothetical protein